MKPKKLLVNATPLLSQLTGIGRYTNEISKLLVKSEVFDMSFFYGYHSKKLITPDENTNVKTLKTLVSKNYYTKKIARKLFVSANKIYSPRYSLYWEPNFIPLESIKADRVVTSVHDFSFELFRDFHPKERVEYFDRYFYKNVKKSSAIITGSEFSKNEIIERLGFDADDIRVVYHGVKHEIFKQQKELDVSFPLPKKFILSAGSIEPRKNLSRLIQAYISLPAYIKNEYKLVLVGFQGWENKQVFDIIEKNKNDIHYLGFVSDIELSKIYNLASIFVFPSIYEGFGLPPLEAMACATPVLASNKSSIPEVCKDKALYFDPYDVNDIGNAIQKALLNDVLLKNLSDKGLKYSKNFTWEKSAQKHEEVFNKFLI